MYQVQSTRNVSSTKPGKHVSGVNAGKHIRCKALEIIYQVHTQGAEESNSTEISVKFTVSMLLKAPYVLSTCHAIVLQV